jgi:RNA polymerase sigma-70 factor (ECF subfamily)
MPVTSNNSDKAGRFRELALPHLDALYTVARYLTRSATDADDAVQECYLRAFCHFDGFRGTEIKPWLVAILRNVCRAEHARRSGLVPIEIDAFKDAVPVWQEEQQTPEAGVLRRQDAEAIRSMVASLPEQFREVIVLRDIEDLSYRDIAQAIDAPIGTVMSRLARARSMLRAAWRHLEGGGKAEWKVGDVERPT